MITILVTGAGGYVGKHLTKKLLEEKYNIIALLKDSRETAYEGATSYPLDKYTVKDVFEKEKIDGVIHLATCYGRGGENITEIASSNTVFPLTVLRESIKNKIKFFINTDTILSPMISEYSLSKNQFKQWLNFYTKNILALNLRIDHFYGPFDNPNKFIAFILKELSENKPFINLTEGKQKRDFVYIDDLTDAYLLLIKNALEGRFEIGKLYNFDVASGIKTSIREAVEMLKEISGNTTTKLNFGAVPLREGEIPVYFTDPATLNKLGWQAKVKLKDGFKKIIDLEQNARRK